MNSLIKITFLLLFSLLFPKKNDAQSIPPTEVFKALKYRYVGPTRGGRVTAVAGIADQPNTFFFGSTGGGLWKSTDYGQNWHNVSDGFFATPSIGAIAISKTNPDIIFVGTGSDGLRSNVITGKGVYKSSDGGTSWKFVGLKNVGQIGAVEIHPKDTNTVFVAAIGQAFSPNKERGVFKTTDGGATWKKVCFLSDTTGAVDLEFHPTNPNIIYASMWRTERKPWTIISGGQQGGIYKSVDGGEHWKKLKNDLPKSIVGKSDLAVSLAQPDRLWVLIEAVAGEGGVYKSDDQGESFQLVSTKKELLDRPFYYCNIYANPLNADVIYVSATQYWKSTDAGKSWSKKQTPHGDNHDLWINPKDTLIMIQSNDGGANVSRDGGKTWSTQNNQPTAELYQVNVDDQFPYWLYAGQQDNSTIAVPSLPPYGSSFGEQGYWRAVGGCETGPAIPKPKNPNIVYSNCKGRFGVYNKITGQEKQYYVGAANMYGHNPKNLKFRFQRVAPIHISPHDPNVIYHCSQYVHKTNDEGKTWEIISPDLTAFTPETQQISGTPITRDITGEEFYSTIYSIQESKLEKGLIWVGANDGPIHLTRNGGKNWTNVTPKSLPKGGRVETIEASPHHAAKAYIAVYRYLLGDWKPYIYKTENYGASWTLLTTSNNGIPNDDPTWVIREDPNQEGILYAGTSFGMFISLDDGKKWQPFQQNIPVTPITDIKVYHGDLVISTMGRGFWILDNLSPLYQLKKKNSNNKFTLFKPRDAFRMRYQAQTKSNTANYPKAGLSIDYFIKNDKQSKLKIEILKNGKLIRSFDNEVLSKDKKKTGAKDKTTGFESSYSSAILNNKKGMHRFIWDMRHAAAKAGKSTFGNRGPLVSPGHYQVKMTYGNKTTSQDFSILIDPRVKADGVLLRDLLAQEKLALQVRDLLSEAQLLAKTIRNLEDKSKNNTDNNKNTLALTDEEKDFNFIKETLITAEGRYQKPMLIDQLRYLAAMLDRADQLPGKDAFLRYEQLYHLFKSLPHLKGGDDR